MNYIIFFTFITSFCIKNSYAMMINGEDIEKHCSEDMRTITYKTPKTNIAIDLKNKNLKLGSTKHSPLEDIIDFYNTNKNSQPSYFGKDINLNASEKNSHSNTLLEALETLSLGGKEVDISQTILKAGQEIIFPADNLNFDIVLCDTQKLTLRPSAGTSSLFESIVFKTMQNSPYPFSLLLNGNLFMNQGETKEIFFCVGTQEIDITFSLDAFKK